MKRARPNCTCHGGKRLLLGYLGEVSPAGLKQFDLRAGGTVAEIKLNTLSEIAELIPQYRQPPVFPAVTRDLNLVVDESVAWAAISQRYAGSGPTVRRAIGTGRRVSRRASALGPGKKSLLVSLVLRSEYWDADGRGGRRGAEE